MIDLLLRVSFSELGLTHAVGLQDVVVVFQHHKVGVLAHLNGALAVVQMQALGRVDGAGVQRVVEGDESLLHKDAQALVDVQGRACQTAGGRQMGAAVGVDDDLIAAEEVGNEPDKDGFTKMSTSSKFPGNQ